MFWCAVWHALYTIKWWLWWWSISLKYYTRIHYGSVKAMQWSNPPIAKFAVVGDSKFQPLNHYNSAMVPWIIRYFAKKNQFGQLIHYRHSRSRVSPVIRPHGWAVAVKSAATVCHAVWSCSHTVSEAVNITIDTTCDPWRRVTILILGESRAIVHRRLASRRQLSWRQSAGHIGNA